MTLLFTNEESLWGRISIEQTSIKKINVAQSRYIYKDGQTSFPRPTVGISENGPYDYNTSNNSLKRPFQAIKILPFVPVGTNNVYENLTKLLEYLISGYYEERKGPYGKSYDIVFGGLKKEFRLTDILIDNYVEYSPGRLSETLDKTDFNVEELRKQKIIPIAIVGGTSHKSYRNDREIYLEVKREFIKRDIPSQFASWYEPEGSNKLGILPATQNGASFGYTLWNFAISIYGKCGGIPWTILQSKNSRGDALVDLTLGMRFSYDHKEAGEGYYIGQATVFDHYGKCIASFTSDMFSIPFHQFKSEGMVVPTNIMNSIVRNSIRITKEHPTVSGLYSKKESLSLAIHRQSLFHNEEIIGIESAISEQKDYSSIRYGLIGISPEPYVMIVPEKTGNQVGECVILSKNTALAYTTRPMIGQPIAYPILIMAQNLGNKENPFSDMSEVCQHVIDLTGLHWQTANSNTVQMPATLQFAAEISKNQSRGIYPTQNSWLKSTNWFL